MSEDHAELDGIRVPDRRELSTAIQLHDRYMKRLPGGRRATLKELQLDGMQFARCDLSEADFTGSTLVDARMEGCILKFACFFGVDLTRSDLRGASFRGASMNGANLSGADIREAVLARARRGTFTGLNEETEATDLSGVQAHGVDLSAAKIGQSFAVKADFTGANMKNAAFQRTDMRTAVFRNANLEGASLVGCRVENADLRGAILTDVHIDDCDFAGADLTGAIADHALLEHPAFNRATKPKTSEELGLDFDAMLAAHRTWVDTNAAEGNRLVLDGLMLPRMNWTGKSLAAAAIRQTTLFAASIV